MLENIIKLTNKYFFITTPNRFFPIDFHTKLPLSTCFQKNSQKNFKIYKFEGIRRRRNLNLLDENTVNKLINTQQNATFKIRIFKLSYLV